MTSNSAQTSFNCINESCASEYSCVECGFEASCKDELNWHMSENHGWPEAIEEPFFTCKHCEENFHSKWDLMDHRKKNHPEKCRLCKNFVEGKCHFSDDTCWYRHYLKEYEKLKEFKCGLCDKSFKLKDNFMEHRKKNHINIVPICKSYKEDHFPMQGLCIFDDKCWYKHEEDIAENDIEDNDNNSPEMITRMMDMMEKFSEKIELLESQRIRN